MPLSQAERSRRYRERHPDKVKERSRAYEATRSGGARVKAWRQASPEKRLAYNAANLDRHAAQEAKRRAAIAQATPAWADLEAIARAYADAQASGLEVDHIVPILSPMVCGLHCMENIRVVPEALNKSKGNRHWPDMFEEKSHL